MLYNLNQFISTITNSFFSRILFALVGGFLFSLTLAYFGWGFYAWFALIPLLILIKSSESFLSSMLEAFCFLIVYNLISFIWILGIHPLTWQGFSYFESSVITALGWFLPSIAHSLILLPFVLLCKIFYDMRTSDRSSELKILDISILSFLWVVIEHKLIINLGDNLGSFFVPINLLAYSQSANKYLIQITNIIGAIGLEFIIVFFNFLISNFFNVQRYRASSLNYGSRLNVKQPFFGGERTSDFVQALLIYFLISLTIYLYGFTQLRSVKNFATNNQAKVKSLAVIQADYSAASYRSSSHQANPEHLIKLQEQLSLNIKDDLDLLLWSEGAVPVLNKSIYANYLRRLNNKAKVFAYGTFNQVNGEIFNSVNYSEAFYKEEEKISEAIKPFEQSHILENNGQNLDFSLEKELTETEVVSRILLSSNESSYNKMRLVPYGEYTPFISLLPEKLKTMAQSVVGEGFRAANETQDIIRTSDFNIATCICFELLFPNILRDQVMRGGELMVNFNDLSWFKSPLAGFYQKASLDENFLGSNWLKKQFLAIAIFRAVENQRDLVLAANAGYSAVITAGGQVRSISDANKIFVLQSKFLPRKKKSQFTLYGW